MEVNRDEIFFLLPAAGSSNVSAIAKRLRLALKSTVYTRHPRSIAAGRDALTSNQLYFILFNGNGMSHSASSEIHATISAITASTARFVLLCDRVTMENLGAFPTDAWSGRVDPSTIEHELGTALPCLQNGRLWCSNTDLKIILGATVGCNDEVKERGDSAPLRHMDMELLTARQRQVAALVSQGARNEVIGESLSISVATVKTHVSRILSTLGFESRTELAAHFRHSDQPR